MTRPRRLPTLATALMLGGLAVPAAVAVGAGEPRPAPAAAPVPFARLAPFDACRGRVAPATPARLPQVLAAFGVLRRAAGPQDALPADVRRTLMGLGVRVDPDAARLVRSTPTGGRAWAIPVAELPAGGPTCVLAPIPGQVLPFTRPGRPRAGRTASARPLPHTAAPPVPPPAAPPRPVVPSAPPPAPPARGAVAPLARPVPAPRRVAPFTPAPGRPRGAGVLVLATGDAPGGAGGTLEELVRGLAPVEVRPCTGPGGSLLGVSGLVPDGVGVVHLTRADGTAVRADVRDDAYAFEVPVGESAAATYVTWTGGDGTPHVQPVPAFGGLRCADLRGPRGAPPARLLRPGVRVSPGFPYALEALPERLRPVLPAPPAVRPLRPRPVRP